MRWAAKHEATEGGFRCTPSWRAKCRISGSGRPSRFELWGARGDHTPCLPMSRRLARSKLHEEQHKGHEIYTGSGHHCGVIPYSIVWCGGLPLGLMMNNTRKNCLARGGALMVVLAKVLLSGRSPDQLDASTLGVASPIYRRRPSASFQILSGKGANNWPF